MNYKEKKNRMMALVLAGMLLTFPLRDAFGYTIKGVPLRLSEIWITISVLVVFFISTWKCKIKESSIILILVFNFIVTVIGVMLHTNRIVLSFAVKYLARNVLWIVVLIAFLGARYEFDSRRVDLLMRYIVWVQVAACIFEVITGRFFNLGSLLSAQESFDANFIRIEGHLFYRLKGTCSEPGYLAPIIAMPLYYFLMRYLDERNSINDNRKNIIYISILLLISLFSFSSAVYGIDFAILCYAMFKSRSSANKSKATLLGLFTILVAGSVILTNAALVHVIFDTVINKISYYVFRKEDISFNFSAVDRAQHVDFAKEMLSDSAFLEKIIGNGTGAYYRNALNQMYFLQNEVSEANNIYLSSLVDRGILGLIGVITTFFYCKKMKLNDLYSNALFCGIIAQGIHWILTGNFWLYTFWFEIIFLIGYRRFISNLNKGDMLYETRKNQYC